MKTNRFDNLMRLNGCFAIRIFGAGYVLFFLCLAARMNASAAAPVPAPVQGTNSTVQGRDFAAFKIIYERNIFNPNRRANSRQTQQGDEPKPVRVETITLTGTMQSDGELYAFFDGSESRYRTALKQKQTIANLTLVEILHDRVKFAGASNSWEVPMLMQLRREDNGDWRLKEGPGFISNTASSSDFSSSSGDSAVDPDVLKRLLKKREQEEGGNTSELEGSKPEAAQQSEVKELDKSASSAGNISSASSTSSSNSSSSSSPDDALKRLLQRREQE